MGGMAGAVCASGIAAFSYISRAVPCEEAPDNGLIGKTPVAGELSCVPSVYGIAAMGLDWELSMAVSLTSSIESSSSSGMSNRSSDQLLVERVKAGDKHAFDLLVLKYQHRIVKLVMRYVRDPSEALDVSQEAFLKAYRALPKFRGDSAFYTWLYRIAINTAKNHLVAARRRPLQYAAEISEPEEFEWHANLQDADSPEAQAQGDELRKAVESAIQELPEDLRAAIILRELDGLTYEEIAQVMECPIGTVRSRIFRAREAIDKEIRLITNET
jgi:RNA polymerase sigma-70 factor (ECF subfamily)